MAPFNTPSIQRLFAAILQLETQEDCQRFFVHCAMNSIFNLFDNSLNLRRNFFQILILFAEFLQQILHIAAQ